MTIIALFNFGWPEMLAIGLAAVLIFGRRLPEVGRDVGKGLMEFKRSLKGVKEELDDTHQAAHDATKALDEPDEKDMPN